MLAVQINFLAGHYYASSYEEGMHKGKAEWPPQPSRLFSALVSTRSDLDGSAIYTEALEWLQEQEAPQIHIPNITRRSNPNIFVPTNDTVRNLAEVEKSSTGKKPLYSIPIAQQSSDWYWHTKQARRRPAVALEHPNIWFVWKATPSEGIFKAIQTLMSSLVYFGCSHTLVAGSASRKDPKPQYAGKKYNILEPVKRTSAVSQYIWWVKPGRLQELEMLYEQFQKTNNAAFRPTQGIPVAYQTRVEEKDMASDPVIKNMFILKKAGEDMPLEHAYLLTSALRGAILSNCSDPIPEAISGHTANGGSSKKAHIAIIPCPHVGGEHGDGRIKGVAVLTPYLEPAEEHQLIQALAAVTVKGLRISNHIQWELSEALPSANSWSLSSKRWNGTSKMWASVTPFIFGRYPKKGLQSDDAFALVVEACKQVGLPSPSNVAFYPIQPYLRGVPSSRSFPPKDVHKDRLHTHVVLHFDEPTAGPMVIGSGRFYGYGLFAPVEDYEV